MICRGRMKAGSVRPRMDRGGAPGSDCGALSLGALTPSARTQSGFGVSLQEPVLSLLSSPTCVLASWWGHPWPVTRGTWENIGTVR